MGDALDKLLPPVRAAIDRYTMLRPGDRVAVGLSGGKDSVALLVLLARLRRFYPAPFELTALTIDPGFGGTAADYSPVTALCEALEVPHIIKRTRLSTVIFEERREANPCSLCARMRRGVLHQAAQDAGCGVVALGHHKNDAAETLMMNLLAGGRLDCFAPVTPLSRRGLTLIRPLIFVEERAIASAVRRNGLPVVKSRCPADGQTHRQVMREMLADLSVDYGPLPDKLVGAMQKAGLSGW